MDQQKREFLINRVISGVYINQIGNKTYILQNPTRTQKYLAQLKYQEALSDLDFEGKFTRTEILPVLVGSGLVTQDIDNKISKLDKDVENLKYQLYLHHLNGPKSKSLRTALKLSKDMYLQFMQARHSLDHLTVEGYAESVKTYMLFSFCLTDSDNVRVDDVSILEKMIMRMNSDRITTMEFRELARTDPWRNYWNANSDYVFGSPVVDWTDDQRTLVLFSKMYDSAYKSVDVPPEYVIADDDLFDGWLINQRKEYEKEKSKSKSKSGKKQDIEADEIYNFQNKVDKYQAKNMNRVDYDDQSTDDFIKETEDQNSLEAKIIKKQRRAALAKGKAINEADLPDIKRDLQMRAQQQVMDRFKTKGK